MEPVALITGASRGIGRGIALTLAECGYHLVVNYAGNEAAARDSAAEAIASAADHGHQIVAEAIQADVGSAADRERLVESTLRQFGRIDLLVNNAGIPSPGRKDLLDAEEGDFDRLMAVNLKGPFFLAQRVSRQMLVQVESAPDAPPPKIINISSISAFTASTNRGDYCIAKAGLAMVTKLFAARLAEAGIRVYEIQPGIIASDMTEPVREKYDRLIANGLTPIRRWGQPRDIGMAVAAIARDEFPFSTGEVFHVDGGFHLHTL